RNYHKLKWSWAQFKRDLRAPFRASLKQLPIAYPTVDYFIGLCVRMVDMGYIEEEPGKQPDLRGRWVRNSLFVIQRAFLMLTGLALGFGTIFGLLLGDLFAGYAVSISFVGFIAPFVLVWLALKRGPSDWCRHIITRLLLARHGVPFRLAPLLRY